MQFKASSTSRSRACSRGIRRPHVCVISLRCRTHEVFQSIYNIFRQKIRQSGIFSDLPPTNQLAQLSRSSITEMGTAQRLPHQRAERRCESMFSASRGDHHEPASVRAGLRPPMRIIRQLDSYRLAMASGRTAIDGILVALSLIMRRNCGFN